MTGAFDGGAFDSVAFDTGEEEVAPGGGFPFMYAKPKLRKLSDDEEVLAVWLMLEEM